MMTEGPWWVDLAAVSGTVVAMGIILRMVIYPGLKAFWQAIVAAPQIASGVGRLLELLETDILHRVEILELNQKVNTDHLNLIDAANSAEKARLDAHDTRLNSLESRAQTMEQDEKRRHE